MSKVGNSWLSQGTYTLRGCETSPEQADFLFPAIEQIWPLVGAMLNPVPLLLTLASCFKFVHSVLLRIQFSGVTWPTHPRPLSRLSPSSDTESPAHHLLRVRHSRPSSCRLWWTREKWRSHHAESSGRGQRQSTGQSARVSRCYAGPGSRRDPRPLPERILTRRKGAS